MMFCLLARKKRENQTIEHKPWIWFNTAVTWKEEVQQNLICQQYEAQPSQRIAFSNQYQFMPCCMDENLLEHILSNLFSNAIKY